MEPDEESSLIETKDGEKKREKSTREKDVRTAIPKPVNFADTSLEASVGPDGKSEGDFSFFKAPRSKKILLLTLGMVNFCAMACFSVLSPFFPKEAEQKNVSETMIGLIFGSFQLAVFITAPVYGNYMTRIGSKFLFLAGIGVCGVCTILFGFVDQIADHDIFVLFCFLTRSVEALGASAYITASFAIISHAYPKHVSTVIGILETFTGAGMMVGPALGSALYAAAGFGLPFYLLGGVLLVCGFACQFVMPNIKDSKQTLSRSVFYLLKSPQCAVICFITMSCAIGFGFIEPVYADRLNEINLSTVLIGVMFLINSAVYALGAPLWGWIGDSRGILKSLLILGNLCTGASFMLLGPAPFLVFIPFEMWAQVLAMVLMGLFSGAAVIPAYNALFEGAVKQLGMEDDFETHGLVSGLYNSFWSLGAFIGPMVAGMLVEEFGFGWACTMCGFLFMIAGFMLLVYVIVERYTSLCARPPSKSGYERIIEDALQDSTP